MPLSKTVELKGLAILMIIFDHVGYFIFPGTNFLWPLSVDMGVGVNIFLFLSGFGLTASYLTHVAPIKTYLKNRFLGLYPTLWLIIGALLVLDSLLLQKSYSIIYIIRSYLGFFPTADLYKDLDSPLWYISVTVFYYLVFPLVFNRKYPVLSAVLMAAGGMFLANQNLPIDEGLLKTYRTHTLAFPLGMLFYSVTTAGLVNRIFCRIPKVVKLIVIVVLLAVAGYTSIHSNVGQGIYKEQLTSLLTVLAFVVAAIFAKRSSRVLVLIGTYSYEIYLIHWPVISRYDVLYKHLNAYIATALYLLVLLLTGYGIKKLVSYLTKTAFRLVRITP